MPPTWSTELPVHPYFDSFDSDVGMYFKTLSPYKLRGAIRLSIVGEEVHNGDVMPRDKNAALTFFEQNGQRAIGAILNDLKILIVDCHRRMTRTPRCVRIMQLYAVGSIEHVIHEVLSNLRFMTSLGEERGPGFVRFGVHLQLDFLSKTRSWGAGWANTDFNDPAFAAQTGIAERIRTFTNETFGPYTVVLDLYQRLESENTATISQVSRLLSARQETLRSLADGTPEKDALRRELCTMANSEVEASRARLGLQVSQIRGLGAIPIMFFTDIPALAIKYFTAQHNMVENVFQEVTQTASCSTLTQAFGRKRGGRRANRGMHLYYHTSMYF